MRAQVAHAVTRNSMLQFSFIKHPKSELLLGESVTVFRIVQPALIEHVDPESSR